MRLAICLLLAAGATAQAEDAKPVIPDDVKATIKARVDAGETAGIIVGVVGPGGETYASAGVLDILKPQKVDPDTIFEIGSVTKAFTGILLADMVQRKEVKLDDPVKKYLPEKVVMPKTNREITLLDLATHHSSLPRLPGNFNPADPDDPYVDYTAENLYEALATAKIDLEVGKAYGYSNLGFGLLGHALARVAKHNYDILAKQRIAWPLGMKSTSVSTDAASKPRLAQGYEESAGKLMPAKPWTWKESSALVGAGGLRSTARDMIRFISANAGLTETKLAPAFADAYAEHDSGSGTEHDIGLAWHRRVLGDRIVIWQNGATGGFHSYCAFDPVNKYGVVVLSNSTADVDDIGVHLFNPLMPLKEIVKPVAVPVEKLAKLDGWYDLGNAKLRITHEGTQLFAQYTGQGRYPVFAKSPTEYVYRVVAASLDFAVKEDGTVTQVTLHQGGRDLVATRMAPGTEPKERVPIAIDAKLLAEYAGRYQQSEVVTLEVKVEGDHLLVRFTGQQWYHAYPETMKDFFLTKVDAQLTFVRDADKKVSNLLWNQFGEQQVMPRLP